MRGLFITGTNTGVGKTVVSAALLTHAPNAKYWKPVQTGVEEDDDAAEVTRLTGRKPAPAPCYRLPNPVSPHLAAQRAGVRINIDPLIFPTDDVWIVEGAGGVLVPLNEEDLMITLIARLNLPTLVVARTTLGTINHTLLTLEALRARSIDVAGVIMVGEANADNRMAVEHYGHLRVAEMPKMTPLDHASLLTWRIPAWLKEYLK